MTLKKTLLLIVGATVLGGLIGWVLPAKATFTPHVICHKTVDHQCMEHTYQQTWCPLGWQSGACPQPTPTPTVAPTPTPIIDPCLQDKDWEECVTPTPTIPEPTPVVPETPIVDTTHGHGDAQPAPSCTDLSTILLPINFFVERAGESATLKWVPTQGEQVNVFYKVVGASDWQFGLGDQPNNGNLVIHALNPQLGYIFGLVQKSGCGGGQLVTSVVVDGPQAKTFAFSYWEWLK